MTSLTATRATSSSLKVMPSRPTPASLSKLRLCARARETKDAHDRQAAEAIARTLVQHVIRLPMRAGPEGRLFGSVTTTNIADAIAEQAGVEIDRYRLQLDEPIKALGTHEVPVRLHSEVEFPVTVEVVRA